MSFAARLTRSPRPFDPDRGAEALTLFPDFAPEVTEVIAGTAGCSPYLKRLMEKEAAWLPEALDDPEQALEGVFDDIRAMAPDNLAAGLRQAKRRVALLTALCDLAGVWQLEDVTGALSRLADLACDVAMKSAVAAEIKRKKLPGATEDDIPTAAGLVALSMGKGGAFELNYSSDIDLICLFDETRYDPDDYFEVRASLIRATRKMSSLLNDVTADGYVFRTDLRLRPDPSVTPVCMAMAAAEAYYESVGRTWERAAYIKARAAAGDIAAGERFLESLRPFVWRKHLDFAAIQDAHDMRLRIREHKGTGRKLSLFDHNMKLGQGGIREIEFFTQTRQLIAGGRDPELRMRATVPGLAALASKGWIPEDAAETLTRHYRYHREVEHRLQMINDAQTHQLPKSDEGFDRLACFMGTDTDALKAELTARLEEVHEVTEGFFAPGTAAPEPEVGEELDSEILQRWQSYPAMRSERAVEIFKRLRPELLRRVQATSKPAETLHALDGFLSGLPAGVQVFSLLEANPQLVDLLIDIAGTSPALSAHLSRNASVFDAVIGGAFFADWPGAQALTQELSARLADEPDYERKLDMARRWAKEWHFRIGVHHLRGLTDADRASREYADLAQAALAALWPVVVENFAEKHGDQPGRGAMLLGMGSLGAGRINAVSDLDLIVIYDSAGVDYSEGRRPLATRAYYARLTQAMVTSVTALMAEGRLYEIDLRLRPSGTQGPVAVSLGAFREYQKTQAWTWEHLALTRARPVAGESVVAGEVLDVRAEVLAMPQDVPKLLQDVADMRQRIADAKSPNGIWDAKIGPGRLQDIELLAQTGALLTSFDGHTIHGAIAHSARCGFLSEPEADVLIRAYDLCWQVQLVSKLLTTKPLDPGAVGEGGRQMLLRETGFDSIDALSDALSQAVSAAEEVVKNVLARDFTPEVQE
ncbi:bifunctional [glutamine synthetase] adenylyltransferase/[glutamine synthetase]-adenylyl-L-tyrosine phosphorylase [Thalassovita sp.]|jgi:glutamate-ammonia-ligase adenylyltransferase|uniref:bifunctional [glutamine synthetase] adenylyltransferase/[glutamine synthetase]-adenylyl-L-tyrosine phosphorylase n=1 Tax=Thalassovita sp. TaxID=1979401 RepID=UPI003B5C1317